MPRVDISKEWPELNEENFKIGQGNGISRKNVIQRYANYGWTIERAITDPVKQPKGIWNEWKEICKQNGVSNELFNIRMRKGATPEQAATVPPEKKEIKIGVEKTLLCECGVKTRRKVPEFENDYDNILVLYINGHFGQCSKCGKNLSTRKVWPRTKGGKRDWLYAYK
jgi:hypothetical protein